MGIFVTGPSGSGSALTADSTAVEASNSRWTADATAGPAAPTEVQRVHIGPAAMAKVYAGADLVWEIDQNFILPGGELVNLETFIDAQLPNVNEPIVVTLQADQVIGSSNNTAPSLTLGDTDKYLEGVTLYVLGEIQGASGPAGNNGGTAIVGGVNSNNVTIVNAAGGAIRGGGGGGGAGGKGGEGGQIDGSWGGWKFSQVAPLSYFYIGPSYHYYEGARLCFGGDAGKDYCAPNNGFIYNKGSFVNSSAHRIRRADYLQSSGGQGGGGGRGQGYNAADPANPIAAQPGATGVAGMYRAGDGGTGGAGGAWGADGAAGADGATGYGYSEYSSAQANNGVLGSANGLAGAAINSNGGTITLLGSGVVNGAVL